MQILRWLWSAWRGNRLQAVLNALIGVLMVAVSLAQVWAVKRAIDVAAGSAGGSLLWAVLYVLVNWCVGLYMYKRKIYIKL